MITKNEDIRERENVCKNVEKCKNILNSWLQRDVTIFGRVLLSKMESLSRSIYPAFSLDISDKMINLLNSLNFKFIWKNKCQYIRRADMVKSIEEGGVNAIDFSAMNGALKLKWLSSFIIHKDSFWFIIPNAIFQKLGGIKFLLRCDYDIYKLPVKLSNYHQQVLRYWKLIYHHNFTPHNSPLWNNRYILSHRNSLFLKSWLDKGIWSVSQILDKEGTFLTHEKLCHKFNLHCSAKQYEAVIKAIPPPFLALTQQLVLQSKVFQLRPLSVEGINLGSKSFSNKFVRTLLTNLLYPCQLKRKYVLSEYSVIEARLIRKRYLSYPIPHKAKEVAFKILNDIYPSNDFLFKRFNWDNNSCIFCKRDIETVEHIFFDCDFVIDFWLSVRSWLLTKQIPLQHLNWMSIKVGVQLKEKNVDFLINNLIMLGKHYIHRCKFLKLKPHFIGWKNELSCYKKSLLLMNTINARKLYSLLELYAIPE